MDPELGHLLAGDLRRLTAALAGVAPGTRAVLAGSAAWGEVGAWRVGGSWEIASDLDLFLICRSFRRMIHLRRDPALPRLGCHLGLRLALDPTVLWQPLLDGGLQGLVGRDLRTGEQVCWPASVPALRLNLARKCLLRWRILAPREPGMKGWYQVVKAVTEGVRAEILLVEPCIQDHALFSLRANRAALDRLDIPARDAARLVLDARLDPGGLAATPTLESAAQAFLASFRAEVVPRMLADPARRPAGSTTARAWWSLLRHGLLPDPRVDYDRALTSLLADPELEDWLATDRALPDLYLAPWRPGARQALRRAVDGALRNPLNAKGDDPFLQPPSAEARGSGVHHHPQRIVQPRRGHGRPPGRLGIPW